MSLRINHNTSSLNAHRNLAKANAKVSTSLQHLSSGLKINTAGEGPASLVASEQLRSQIASIDQAVKNSEVTVSMVQTAEGALGEANNALVNMRQLAIHAANEGVNDDVMLAADQAEVSNLVAAIDRIADYTQFGEKKLLDGSNGVSGEAIGEGLEFVSASNQTKSSDSNGYDVVVTQAATQSSLVGKVSLTKELIDAGEELSLIESGKTATYITKSTDTVDSAIVNFASAARESGLDVIVEKASNGAIEIRHKELGTGYSFSASSSTAGVISANAGEFQVVENGADLMGRINGEIAIGKGDTMTSVAGSDCTDGLTVRYRGKVDIERALSDVIGNTTECAPREQSMADQADNADTAIPETGKYVGKVFVDQNSLTFQTGPSRGQTVKFALQNTASDQLAKGVMNSSGFSSLADINVTSAQTALDSTKLIDAAVNEVTKLRSQLGSFQKNTLEVNLANMRIASENMVAAESVIRDTDMAYEMAEFTRNDLIMQSATAMLAQANQTPAKVMRLLTD